ncbi:zonular occludens toxin domain-containing protein [Stutzerimonas nitrititolerans]|uniref:zonular occludens toxin domain-containing protein n=1 Tax=Stutzerimonas nitrititolerans TaxID=2482751 RepID=UPI00289DEC4A|nr:zonular occludens toxin domain-containing protein [Stutzerimonas nitrititolerans]
MFVLRTGLQGNGKTLNTIKEVDLRASKMGRIVYYHNIRGFKPDHESLKATWVEFEDPQKWFELPENAMIVIDEAQTFFRVRPNGSAVPKYASALETMRHNGHELHCITQNPGLLDNHFRKLCNSHIHYVRGGKGKVIKRWEFEKVCMAVETPKRDFANDGEATRVVIDPKYFGVYESVKEGATHHMKFKPPRALYIFGACVLFIGYVGYGVYERRIAKPEGLELASAQEISSPGAGHAVPSENSNSRAAPVLTAEQYVDMRVPRLPDVPSSAPMYDELTRPVAYPKLSCVSSSDSDFVNRNRDRFAVGIRGGSIQGCRCNTQQGTRAVVSFDACLSYVVDGAFDPAKPDRDAYAAANSGGQSYPSQPVSPAQAAEYVPRPITTVGGRKPGHLW